MRLVSRQRKAEEGEQALLLRAADGDTAATRQFYRAHVDMVYRHVCRVLGRDDGDVEDVVQQVFLAALASADRFEGRSKLSTWLLGIATRRALDEARARARRGRWRRIGEGLGALVGLGRPSSPPDSRHDATCEAEELLAILTPVQRTVFVLKEVEGYTLQEISDMTEVGISTLHARLKAARRRLDVAIAERGARHA